MFFFFTTVSFPITLYVDYPLRLRTSSYSFILPRLFPTFPLLSLPSLPTFLTVFVSVGFIFFWKVRRVSLKCARRRTEVLHDKGKVFNLTRGWETTVGENPYPVSCNSWVYSFYNTLTPFRESFIKYESKSTSNLSPRVLRINKLDTFLCPRSTKPLINFPRWDSKCFFPV